jgi:hypothetical protein
MAEPLPPTAHLRRERLTVEAMIRLACRLRHGGGKDLCSPCRELLDYASLRLDRCPFQADKPTCAQCPVHCYVPARREQIREIMAFAGPRMLLYHPLLALMHILDGWRKPGRKQKN